MQEKYHKSESFLHYMLQLLYDNKGKLSIGTIIVNSIELLVAPWKVFREDREWTKQW